MLLGWVLQTQSLPRRYISLPAGSEGCPSGDFLCLALPRAPAFLLACYLGRQLHSPEVSAFLQQGLTQRQVLFGACSGAPALPSDRVGHLQLHASPVRAAPGLANGPLILLAAGLDWG